ncbi:hypothetical protein BDY19DRAFT_996101 [Irpex rosettiformis]|uniref:Uncharacterized protein n=1 Tax=Irpex rosettiformis TaxID=378272 RepID=A0ACB8TW33_9APHY|nr:hypothetical protein BDY19DRAFT_996101 [Irpex rosettiformis]
MQPTAWPLPPRSENSEEHIDWANLPTKDKEVLFSWLDEFFAAYFSRMKLSKVNEEAQQELHEEDRPVSPIFEEYSPPLSPSISATTTESVDSNFTPPPTLRQLPPPLPSDTPRLTHVPPRAPRLPRPPRQHVVRVPPSALRQINRTPSLPAPKSNFTMHTRTGLSTPETPAMPASPRPVPAAPYKLNHAPAPPLRSRPASVCSQGGVVRPPVTPRKQPTLPAGYY